MEETNEIQPVYSYKKFKELADDRMSQVKIFVQSNANWEPAGKGVIRYYQIFPEDKLQELKQFQDFNSSIRNFFIVIDSSEVDDLQAEEIKNIKRYSNILKTRQLKGDNIIAFYDITVANDFDFDLDR